MSSDPHPYEPATPEESSGISDSEAQMLAKRLAKAKDRIEELEALLRRTEDVMRAVGLGADHKTLMDDVRTALVEARKRAEGGQS